MEMSTSERLQYATGRKDAAARYFGAGRFAAAQERYRLVWAVLDFDGDMSPEEKAERRTLRLASKQNEAMCKLKLGDTAGATAACTEALKEQPDSEKALYRRAMSYQRQGQYALAEADLRRCMEVNPGNAEARRLLATVRQEAKGARGREKKMFAKMLAGDGD